MVQDYSGPVPVERPHPLANAAHAYHLIPGASSGGAPEIHPKCWAMTGSANVTPTKITCRAIRLDRLLIPSSLSFFGLDTFRRALSPSGAAGVCRSYAARRSDAITGVQGGHAPDHLSSRRLAGIESFSEENLVVIDHGTH
jgi:hypothetical protein